MNIEAKLDALRANPIAPISVGANHQEALSKYNTAGKMRTAAVMVPIIKNNYRYELLLTKRAQHLKDHAGEICFPGGSMEQTDGDHLEAALRETREEVGINSTEIEIIGTLPSIPTLTGFMIHPVIGLVDKAINIVIAPSEVESYLTVPFLYFLNDDNKHESMHSFKNTEITMIEYHYNGARIWGATAMIISSLCKKIKEESM